MLVRLGKASKRPYNFAHSLMTLTDVGTIASILSLAVSIFVLYDVRKIKNSFKIRVRGPAVIKELQAYSFSVNRYLNQFEDFVPQIAEEFGKAQAKLKYLEKSLPVTQKRSIRALRRSIEKCEVLVENRKGVHRVYVEMTKVLEELKDHQKDLRSGV